MNIQKIGDRTAELLNLYYNNEIEPFLNSCHEDVLWIGPADKQVIRGRKNLVDAYAVYLGGAKRCAEDTCDFYFKCNSV